MIPVCRNEISTRAAGTDFTLRLHGEIKFHSGKAGQFSTWYLFKYVYIFFKFFFVSMSVYENPSIQKQSSEVFSIKKLVLRISQIFTESTCLGVNLLKRDSNTGFPVSVVKFLRTPILKNICKRLLLSIPIDFKKSSAVLCQFFFS